jgi:branched-chain amino acid transport system ATP-binding protein
VLEIRDMVCGYGNVTALRGISLQVKAGQLVALIGANGAGKSTTLRAICGLLAPRAGSVRYAGADTAGVPMHELPRRGLVMVPEGRGIFPQLSVAENLAMGAFTRSDGAVAQDIEHQYERFPRLKERRAQTAGTLSGGEQQMLAIGRALMARPKLLLLDEPSMGLAPRLVARIFDIVREIAKQGVTILLVEQNARLALEVASRGYVMESGLITLSAGAQQLLADPKVREAYLGEAAGGGAVSA